MSTRLMWSRYVGAVTGDPGPLRANKYSAKAVEVDGLRFDSMKEARRYGELRLLEVAGQVSQLSVHPRYPIKVVELWRKGPRSVVEVGVYTADFRYLDEAGEIVIEDVKCRATMTTAYRLRKRLVEAIYGITITEV